MIKKIPKINIGRFDWLLFVATFLLVSIGLLVQYSLGLGSGNFSGVIRQSIFFGVGLIFLLVLTFVNYRYLQKYAYQIYIFSLVLLIATLVFGRVVRGTQGWLFGFQVAEFAKFALIIVLARFWGDNLEKYPRTRKVILGLGLMAIPVILILLQPDFGSASILIAIGIGSILMIDRSGKKIASLVLIGIVLIASAWFFFFEDYQKDRILNFVDPQRDPFGSGYQVTQSITAIGSGGILGRGFGLGSQSQLKFLPEAGTDFVFSVVSEEFGFMVSLLVLVLYGIIIWRLAKICFRAYDDFSLMASFGIAIFVISQVFVNIGMNLGLAPITGITLPFLSYGGSSLLMSLAMVGFAESLWRHQVNIS